MKLGGHMSDRPGPEILREDLSYENAAAQTSLGNHLPATIPIPITKIPIKQRIKIPPNNMASIKAIVIMTFLRPVSRLEGEMEKSNQGACWQRGKRRHQ
jgi:hypothetical protein